MSIDYRKYKFDALQSPKDERDFKISYLTSIPPSFPKSFRIPYNHPVKDQETIGSCVGHAMAYLREITEELQHGKYIKLSPGFVYANRVEGRDYFGEGMYPRTALINTMNRGICEYDLFPENEEFPVVHRLFNERWFTIIPNAAPHKYNAYTLVMSEVEIKTALMKLGAVMLVMPIHESFFNVSKANSVVPIPQRGEKDYGGHAMTITGWREDGTWIVLNSWGEEWGDGGYCYLPIGFPTIWECWSITDNILPNVNKEFLIEDEMAVASRLYNRKIEYIIVHHPGDGLAPQVSIERRWNPHRYRFPAYDYGVEHDGEVKVGRPLNYYGAHTRADRPKYASDMYFFNRNAIGVAIAGDFTRFTMSKTQFDGLVSLVRNLMKVHNIPIEKVLPHGAVSFTHCAGCTYSKQPAMQGNWNFDQFIEALKNYKEDDGVDNAILIFSNDDFASAVRLSARYGNCAIYVRKADRTAPADVFKAKRLFVVGGTSVGHSNEEILTGANWFESNVAVGKHLGFLK